MNKVDVESFVRRKHVEHFREQLDEILADENERERALKLLAEEKEKQQAAQGAATS